MSPALGLSIGGQTVQTAAQFVRRDPLTGEVATQASAASVVDAIAAADAAAGAFPAWSVRGPNERRSLMMRAATALEARSSAFLEAMMAETGATEGWVRFNLMRHTVQISLASWVEEQKRRLKAQGLYAVC